MALQQSLASLSDLTKVVLVVAAVVIAMVVLTAIFGHGEAPAFLISPDPAGTMPF